MASSPPSQPVNIGSPRARPAFAAPSGTPGAGTPASLRVPFYGTPPPVANIPPRSGTPRNGGTPRASPALLPSATSESPRSLGGLSASRPVVGTPGSGAGASDRETMLDELTEEEKARVLRKHLVSREEREQALGGPSRSDAGSEGGRSRRSSHAVREDSEAFPVPYHAPGADITHTLYKWQADQRRKQRPRAASFSAQSSTSRDPAFENIHEPGGFRRAYVLQRAGENGDRPRMLRNFVEFLFIFGHFAGEDLEEIDEEDEGEEGPADAERAAGYETYDGPSAGLPGETPKPDERTPLMGHRRPRSKSIGPHGDATVTQAVLVLLKGFVGTGILFLGRAFYNGGILFSAFLLSFIALVSLYSFLLLVKAKFVVSGSFGDIGGALYGPYMRYAILSSIVISQLGFVSAYIIFVSENLQAFVAAVSGCTRLVGLPYFILLQLVVFLPLALIRNLAKLSTTALVADVFIVAGLIYIFGSEAIIMAERGPARVELFNPRDFPLLIGTAIFSFEGIGLVIPVTDAMKEPRKFPAVLTGVMIALMFLFGGAGVMSYLTFGADVQTVIMLNLDDSRMLQSVQLLYSLAIMLSVPLQLFPAVRIMENGLFVRSGRDSARVKWTKNVFRFGVVFTCAFISWLGSSDLDKFVAFIGSFACVPLCYVYPAMLHLKACARTRRQKIADWVLIVFGIVAAVYSTAQTVKLMVAPAEPGSPVGRCITPTD
ncbi:hypothetical protein PUNSTDRAFT_86492 [Punctularia strigosozonata HHB-11173 SS5]|uniref:uncharacterized protein n=1 Tax=Punctularia strigosozonata (strain HHB-11173) TaxID=741275 RepID=UPI00044178A1|nr:uncharacterized protein PUNSTDRAFT_86492 [Punctularia strigosozonata HHB-11173 SS5]EIN09975.1 hypothetical protein PUNSTDRAFT_86492 [Punctularia strigosozonata HHB-11173 SS5]